MKRFLCFLIACMMFVPLAGCANDHDDSNPAMEKLRLEYNKEVKRIHRESLELKNLIEECRTLLNDEREPLNPETRGVLQDTIEDAEIMLDDHHEIPDMSERPEEMENIIADLEMVSYTEMTEALQFARDAYSRSLDEKDEEQKEDPVPVITMSELRDGVYLSLMLGSHQGEPEGLGTCYKIVLEGNELVVSGSWSYRENPDSAEYDGLLANDVYRFPVTGATQYVQTGGDMVVPYDSPQELVDTVQHDMDTNNGLALVIVVENGTVTSVATAS